jgi:hypothetical protein
MKITGIEEQRDERSIELECLTCGYTRVVSMQPGKLVVRGACPLCKKAALQRKHQRMIEG